MKKLNYLFKAEKFRSYGLSVFSFSKISKLMNMGKFAFTDEMAYECDHCAEPWKCTKACEKIVKMAMAGGGSR